MTDKIAQSAVIEPSPDNPGWMTFNFRNTGQYNSAVIGPVIVQLEPPRSCRVRINPRPHLTNAFDQLHGGGVLGMIDVSLFAAMRFIANHHTGGVTLDLNTQFIGAGKPETPTDVVVELLRETGKLLFLRGKVEQGDHLIAAFSGALRKIDAAKPR